MTERPILFSAPMVRAILDGRKTMTRRVAKITHRTPGLAACLEPRVGDPRPHVAKELCPYGQPGDRLWVREAFAGSIAYERHGYPLKEWGNKLWYLADGEPRSGQWTRPRPSIHMPRCLSRITLEITEVRVERVNDISEEDSRAEGAPEAPTPMSLMYSRCEVLRTRYREGFADLWESIHGPGSWAANPWVWVVGFRRLT